LENFKTLSRVTIIVSEFLCSIFKLYCTKTQYSIKHQSTVFDIIKIFYTISQYIICMQTVSHFGEHYACIPTDKLTTEGCYNIH